MKTLIIAEAGINHNGSLDLAIKLVDEAANAGADYIKFQTFKTELNISKTAKKAKYQIENSENIKESQFDMVKKLELSFDDFRVLSDYCKRKRIGFLSTAFDSPSIDFLDEIGQSFYKIPSGEITNKPYLQQVSRKGKPVILSTGMSNLGEIESAMNVMISEGLTRDMITILHCNTEYPTPMEDVNLKAMLSIKAAFQVKVGYSDHTKGMEVPIAAVALGAEVIEKHFTLDRKLPGPDHLASLEPLELHEMIIAIRNIEQAIGGNGIKAASKSEIPNKEIARKSIHLINDMKIGEIVQYENLIMKRPGDGISPMLIDLVIGRKVNRKLSADEKLIWKYLG